MENDSAFKKMMQGFGLTTANILYRLPDHQSILQQYIWQEYDLFPQFPKLRGFLEFWHTRLDGPLFKVVVDHQHLITPAEIRKLDSEFTLN